VRHESLRKSSQSGRLKDELLHTDGRFDQCASVREGENRHVALVVVGSACAAFDEGGGRVRGECQFALLQAVKRLPVVEENDLAEGVAAELNTELKLQDGRVTDEAAVLEDLARPVGCAGQHSRLTDHWENCISVGFLQLRVESGVQLFEARQRRLRVPVQLLQDGFFGTQPREGVANLREDVFSSGGQ